MKFDLNPDTFTLQNMFAMELHKFQDVIGDITASATKELGIEKGISEVADTWGSMKFTVSKFMKGTQERGFILGAVDEILQILDDNAMNLQSMSASRFVGPFLETVNKWEKSLSHIGEVVEVRMTVVIQSVVNCLSVKFQIFIIHSPWGFSGIIYDTVWGTAPDCL